MANCNICGCAGEEETSFYDNGKECPRCNTWYCPFCSVDECDCDNGFIDYELIPDKFF
jgi:hypothetical protein